MLQTQFKSIALLLSLFLAHAASRATASESFVGAEHFMKIRCNLSAENAITTWSGNVTTTGVGPERSQTLFKIVGFNIARCFKDESGNWTVTSRELTFYLDPQTGALLNQWKNPWTGETVPVVHIANALVQQKIPAAAQLVSERSAQTAIVRIDVPLSYPNPLAGDNQFAAYSPEPTYKAHESFTYILSREDLDGLASNASVVDVQVSWTRVSPWLPWMKMGALNGHLVFNALVQKQKSTDDIPELIRSQIASADLGIYLDAPKCVVKNQANVSSWTYFKNNFGDYLRGSLFPRPEPASRAAGECNFQ
ncbi:MAG: hypothetical protein RLZZ488_1091 [Pseudomonadota bacterium]|jgi:hypothetical protein